MSSCTEVRSRKVRQLKRVGKSRSKPDIVSWTLGFNHYDQNKPLYIDPNEPSRYLSANITRKLVRQLSCGLRANGLGQGDCVCVLSFNDIYYTSLFLGIIGAGGCFSGANPGYTVYEVVHHIRSTGSKFVLTSLKTLETATAAATECGLPASKIFILDHQEETIPEGHQSWRSLLCAEEDWVSVKDADNTIAAYLNTSGTSGLPKAALIPHSYLVSQGKCQQRLASASYEQSTLIATPPFHAFTLPLQHLLPLVTGTRCYVLPRFDAQQFADACRRFHITDTAIVPPIMMALAKVDKKSKLASLRRIYTAGSCASDGMQQQLYGKISAKAKIVQVFGMTECGWATSWQRENRDASGSIGQALPGFKIRLVDSSCKTITTPNTKGEIQIKVPHPMKGYRNDPLATAETLSSDNWIRTGDIGYTANSNWYIIDRLKDLIKVRGWQVSPAEIEAALLLHPSIADAAIIGIPDLKEAAGEVPMAFIVRNDKKQLDEAEVKRFLSVRLARYKSVDKLKFVDRIPRSSAGKILRRVLRESVKGVNQQSVDQVAAATAYSTALRELKESQLDRKKDCNSSRGMRAGSLTDGETAASSRGAVTPPASDTYGISPAGTSGRKRAHHDMEEDDTCDGSNIWRRRLRVRISKGQQ